MGRTMQETLLRQRCSTVWIEYLVIILGVYGVHSKNICRYGSTAGLLSIFVKEKCVHMDLGDHRRRLVEVANAHNAFMDTTARSMCVASTCFTVKYTTCNANVHQELTCSRISVLQTSPDSNARTFWYIQRIRQESQDGTLCLLGGREASLI